MDESDRYSSAPVLLTNIKQANHIDDLLKIFDKYIIPAEFALGLQKMCQLASIENSDAIHTYARSENARNRVESLLISFVSRLRQIEISWKMIICLFSWENLMILNY